MSTNWAAIIDKAQSIAPTKAHVELLSEALRKVGEERDDALRRCAELEARLLRLERPPEMSEHMGVLWKRTTTGFEKIPYCRECPTHPIMFPFPSRSPKYWICSEGHQVPRSVTPPQG